MPKTNKKLPFRTMGIPFPALFWFLAGLPYLILRELLVWIREPMAGKEVVLPVGPKVFHVMTGYRAVIRGMIVVHETAPDDIERLLGHDQTVFLPTREVCPRQLKEATRKATSSNSATKLGRVVYEEDTWLSNIVGSFQMKVDGGATHIDN